MQKRVIKSYSTKYNNPLVLKKGDMVKLGVEEKEEKWRGWIWATLGNISGWIPKQIVGTIDENNGIISEDFSAKELNVTDGEFVIPVVELNGWLWVRSSWTCEEGWIPKENVESLKMDHY
ncbi:MAG: SH3 domain-containing protein [Bacteroidota bacterium]|nr:SH3 domain-containing protein [Bacteroidota bacterium]